MDEMGEQNRSYTELLDSEAKYRALFTSIDAGFCIIKVKFDDAQRAIDYQFLEVNPSFERQTGLFQAEGQWMRTLAPGHEQDWFDIYGNVAVTGQPVRFERAAAALQERWFEVYAFPIGERAGQKVAVLFSDITERKRSAAQLEQAHRELQQSLTALQRSNEDLEQFARVAGHDLRAPLSNIIQFTQLLERRQKDAPADTKEIFSHIVESGKRMSHLLDDLLRYATLAQVANGEYNFVNASVACSHALEHLRVIIEESGSLMQQRLPERVMVSVDLSALTLVFQNLIANAIHYRRDGIPAIVEIAVAPCGTSWRFTIADNGQGIAAQFRQQIFEPFRRLHGHDRPGSGIGLATCRRIVERAGGSIGVESEVGKGSTFFFLLPRPAAEV